MVSVLALNRLELREMINTEMVANPVLEELSEEATTTDNYSDETFLKNETEKVPEKKELNAFDEFDVGSFFNQYLDTGGDGGRSRNARFPSVRRLKNFCPRPQSFRTFELATERHHLLRPGARNLRRHHRQSGRKRLLDRFQ